MSAQLSYKKKLWLETAAMNTTVKVLTSASIPVESYYECAQPFLCVVV